MIVVSVAFLMVITADLALAIGKSTRGNLSPPSEPRKENQHAMANNLQSIDDVKRENMKKTIDLTSFLENDNAMDHLASKFIKDHGSGHISKGEVKESIKKISQLLKRDDLKVHTPKERFEYLVQDLTSQSPLSSTYSEFHFCKAIIEKMPDDFLATHFENITDNEMNAMMTDFGEKCTIADSENPIDLNPLFIDSFQLCSHLPEVLKLHLSFGLPDYVASNSEHFCTYLVDVVFPSETEQPCFLIMEQMQYQYAKEKDKLIPYPGIVLSNDFEDTFMEVCTSSIMGNKTEDFCNGSFKAINETSQEALKEGSTMTILQYTDHFCSSVNLSLAHPGNSLLEKNKSRKHGTRNAVSHAFSLAQGYRHGILDSTGKLIQSTSEDLHGSPTYKDTNLGEITAANHKDKLGAGCSHRAHSVGIGGSLTVGPISIGGGRVHGYGYKAEGSIATNWQYAEGDFDEICLSTSLPDLLKLATQTWQELLKEQAEDKEKKTEKVKKTLNDRVSSYKATAKATLKLMSVAASFSMGFFHNFDNIPGYTRVTTTSASALIFEMSGSSIECCGGSEDIVNFANGDCERCGSAFGMSIIFPPVPFSADASIEGCYAKPVSGTIFGTINPEDCSIRKQNLFLDCGGGPYHQITILSRMFAQERMFFRGTICSPKHASGDDIMVVHNVITFFTESRFGVVHSTDAIVFRNNLPGQEVLIKSIIVVPQRELDHSTSIRNNPSIWGETKISIPFVFGSIYRVDFEGERSHTQSSRFAITTLTADLNQKQKGKCEGWGFIREKCLSEGLVDHGIGCYWNEHLCVGVAPPPTPAPTPEPTTPPPTPAPTPEPTTAVQKQCVECDCNTWNGFKYSNCVQRPRAQCKSYCVRCEMDGVTPMPGHHNQHDEQCEKYEEYSNSGWSITPTPGYCDGFTSDTPDATTLEECKSLCVAQTSCTAITWYSSLAKCFMELSTCDKRTTSSGGVIYFYVGDDCKDGGFHANGAACKEDDIRHCGSWASSGECQRNPAYMLDCCRKSCNVCR